MIYYSHTSSKAVFTLVGDSVGELEGDFDGV